MLVQIYETSSAEEAVNLAKLGGDHIGFLVGDGSFPREQSIEAAQRILSAVPPRSKKRPINDKQEYKAGPRETTPSVIWYDIAAPDSGGRKLPQASLAMEMRGPFSLQMGSSFLHTDTQEMLCASLSSRTPQSPS
jgi:hypothetical protein